MFYLSRITLNRSANSLRAMANIFVPSGKNQQHKIAHHLLWSLFTDTEETRRDFLWRQIAPGSFLVLSDRKPIDHHNLFKLEVKEFSPNLLRGEKLSFILRLNATIDRKIGEHDGKAIRKRIDIVADEMRQYSADERDKKREEIRYNAALKWFTRKGETSGFSINLLDVEKEDRIKITDRKNNQKRKGQAIFGVLDIEGVLTVKDPDIFLASICKGFGRAKAFGCGLMLIKPY